MKVSKYTFFIEISDDNEFYAYNTLSNALIEIDGPTYSKLKNIQSKNDFVEKSDYDRELFETLLDNTIITDSDKDDFLKLKACIMQMRAQRSSMHLTLAPTMDCCFNCHYCFEKFKSKIHLQPDIMDGIIKYIKSCKDLKTLHLTWFGGEPLMAIDEIDMFYDKLKPLLENIQFSSNIVTTGYHLNEKVIEVLNKVQVTSVQITLDGLPDTHNKVKYIEGEENVFYKILDNIELYNKLAPNVNIVIRVNLTHENEHEYISLYKILVDRFKDKPMIAPAPAFVMDRGTTGAKFKPNLFFNHKERACFILDLSHRNIHSPQIRYPKNFFYECAIRNNMAIAFDAEGYAYKCWEVLGNKRYAIGKMDSDGIVKDINGVMLNRQLYGADPLEDPKCRECKYLPLCNGGCPIHRIENEFDDGKNNCCIHYKGYMEEFLKEHIRRRKMGLSNR